MSWSLTVVISAGMIGIGVLALAISRRAHRPLACATILAGMALLFAAQARDRGDATGLLAAWFILGVWSLLVLFSWHNTDATTDTDVDLDEERAAP